MSIFSEALVAIKEALKLADEVRRLGDGLAGASGELRLHDRRITRLEARWDTAVELASSRAALRRLDDKS